MTEYIKCETCGAVGNWPEFIEKGLCHNKPTDWEEAFDKKIRLGVFTYGSDRERVKDFIYSLIAQKDEEIKEARREAQRQGAEIVLNLIRDTDAVDEFVEGIESRATSLLGENV